MSSPGVPTGVHATAGDGHATVYWNLPEGDGVPTVNNYTIVATPSGASATVPGSVPFATVNGLTNGISYTFTVIAVNDVGSSGYSAASNTVVPRSQAIVQWDQMGSTIVGTAEGDWTGAWVTLSADGSIMAIGESQDQVVGGGPGRVRVFAWNGSSWTQQGSAINGLANDDFTGKSCALSANGTILAISSIGNDTTGTNAGQVRVFGWNGADWVQRGSPIYGDAAGDYAGSSVALSADGTVLAVGAYLNNGGGTNSGQVRIFYWNGGSWIQRGDPIYGSAANDEAGISVALSADGSVLAVGIQKNDAGNGADDNRGCARIYFWNGGSWIQRGLDIVGDQPGDKCGNSVSLNAYGTTIAVSSYGYDSLRGLVRVFDWTGGAWTKRGSSMIGDIAGSYFGFNCFISGNGNRVIVGAPFTGSGKTYVYNWNGGEWALFGQTFSGQVSGDREGVSVVMSTDGLVVATGAPLNDLGGTDAGCVRAFQLLVIIPLPPEQPTGVHATAGDGRATVFWTPPASDGGSTITGYTVTANPGGATATVPGSVPFATVAGLSNDTAYTFTVTATNAVGTSSASLPTNVVTPHADTTMAWVQRGLDIDGEAENDWSGYSVSISADGSVVAIGALNNDGTISNSDVGHVRVYAWNGTAWIKRGNDINGEAAGDKSGWSVSLSANGSVIAIGATGNDGTISNSDVGHVRVYVWDGTTWVKRGNDIVGEAAGDKSGYSVSLSADGSIVAIGATGNDGTISNSNVGHVRVYAWNGTTWVQRGLDIDGEAANDWSGYSVSISADGSVVAIGGRFNNGTIPGSDVGHVRIYVWNGTAWIQRGDDINGEAPLDYSGFSVSLSADGSIVAIGAPNNDGTIPDSDVGHVRVYVWNGTAWIQRGDDINGETPGDQSGWSVSLSADGLVVAIGAINNNGTGWGAGHVRVYAWDGTAWIQRGLDINAEAEIDKFGSSLFLSADGSVVAIGGPFNDGNGLSAGHVRIYSRQIAPSAPTGVHATPGDKHATVFWTPPAGDDGVTTIDSYTVTASPGGAVVTVAGTATMAVVAGLNNDTDYTFTVVATNGAGSSDPSTPSNIVKTRSYTATGWVTQGSPIVGQAVGNQTGYSVAVSADTSTVAVGEIGMDDVSGGTEIGQVRLFTWDGSSWAQRGSPIVGEAASDRSGYSLSLSADGSVVAIGAPYNNGAAGHVRVFAWDGSDWTQRGDDIDGIAGDEAGWSVSLSSAGTAVIVGAIINGGGRARVYTWNDIAWIQQGDDITGAVSGDQAGWSVAISADGSIVAVGAIGNDAGGNAAGQVNIYRWSGSTWATRGSPINGTMDSDFAGWSVSLSADGAVLAVGAANTTTKGTVRVYVWDGDGNEWNQRGSDISGENVEDRFGASVSLSADGSIVAVGAPGNDGGANNAGHARVFWWNAGSWTQLGADLDGGAASEQFGYAISLSANATRLAVTSMDSNNQTGYVQMYNIVLPPEGPTDVVARAGNATATVTWLPPDVTGGDDIVSYTVISEPEGLTATVDGFTTTATVYGLTNGTVYRFRVKAINSAGEGLLSEPSAWVTPVLGGIPCFFGDARVLTPGGYRRLDSVQVGDLVQTPAGETAAIRSIKRYTCAADPSTCPYIIPAGKFGATRRLLISPDHKICLPDGRRVPANRLGLEQEMRKGSLTYYNLELEEESDMIIEGVTVESLQHMKRIRVTTQQFTAMLRAAYADITPAVLARVKRTCRFLEDGMVDVPVKRR